MKKSKSRLSVPEQDYRRVQRLTHSQIIAVLDGEKTILKKLTHGIVEHEGERYFLPKIFAAYKNAHHKVIQALMECKKKTSIQILHGSKSFPYYKESDLKEVCDGLNDLEYATNIDSEGHLLMTVYSFIKKVDSDIEYLKFIKYIKSNNLEGFPTNRQSKWQQPVLAYPISELRQLVKLITTL